MFNWLNACQFIKGQRGTAFYKKRDHTQIIVDILSSCRRPHTKSYIRRRAYVSYGTLQDCVKQLLMRDWLEPVEENCGQKKLATTQEGLAFIQKYLELENLTGLKSKCKSKMATHIIPTVLT